MQYKLLTQAQIMCQQIVACKTKIKMESNTSTYLYEHSFQQNIFTFSAL